MIWLRKEEAPVFIGGRETDGLRLHEAWLLRSTLPNMLLLRCHGTRG